MKLRPWERKNTSEMKHFGSTKMHGAAGGGCSRKPPLPGPWTRPGVRVPPIPSSSLTGDSQGNGRCPTKADAKNLQTDLPTAVDSTLTPTPVAPPSPARCKLQPMLVLLGAGCWVLGTGRACAGAGAARWIPKRIIPS
ncbi:hypothetical protein BGZ63DRAFT_403846 [Mariannaea sp. PMI_226]|nr:hypothetical protein BGZ63DRAFT_403846 [Mariannaea sp. PMI_226]